MAYASLFRSLSLRCKNWRLVNDAKAENIANAVVVKIQVYQAEAKL